MDYVAFIPSASSSRRIKAADERHALARTANIVTHRAKTKRKKQTALLCCVVETPSTSTPFVLQPVAYVSADACGVLLGNSSKLDAAAYLYELELVCRYSAASGKRRDARAAYLAEVESELGKGAVSS